MNKTQPMFRVNPCKTVLTSYEFLWGLIACHRDCSVPKIDTVDYEAVLEFLRALNCLEILEVIT